MSQHDERDARLDAMLRDVGPSVPKPDLDARAMHQLRQTIASPTPTANAHQPWMGLVRIGLVAGLAVACVVLAASLWTSTSRLAESRWETKEALTLLMLARSDQENIVPDPQLVGVEREDVLLLFFDHQLCPLSRECRPAFQRLAGADDAPRSLSLDITGAARTDAAGELEKRAIEYALSAPLGAETGVVKVLDTKNHRVLSSAPGRRGIQQAQRLLDSLQ